MAASFIGTRGTLATERPSFLVGSPISLGDRIGGVSLISGRSQLPLPSNSDHAHVVHMSKRSAVRPPITCVATVSDRLERAFLQEKAVKFKVRAIVTIRKKNKEDLKGIVAKQMDALCDKMGKNVLLQIVSTEIDQNTKTAKRSSEAILQQWLKKSNVNADRVEYTAEFTVTSDFGQPGAITVTNHHRRELFLESIVLEGFIGGPVYFTCNSWVQSITVDQEKRIFFSNKAYLPSETPEGLIELRAKELEALRGDGSGTRKQSDRIYDFDVYNDLGKPDLDGSFARPTLGGEKIPYPRRCRTGRSPTDADINCESRIEKPKPMYVPRDDAFEDPKRETIRLCRFRGVLHNLVPSLKAFVSDENHGFKGFQEIQWLYRDALITKFDLPDQIWKKLPLPKPLKKIEESSLGHFRYDTPSIISNDKFAWLRDDEFARQMLAGVNPVNIERLTSFPPFSKLDPELYGPPESAIREEHIIGQLDGKTVKQALEENRLFMVDYHDVYLPFIDRINSLDGRRAYATRSLFFLTNVDTLKPIAIELSLPYSKRVITPAKDGTSYWLWELAKAHVRANDAGAHQLVNHWLRTHACMEPFILSANRQMSAMHPIMKLLQPHTRYTLEINAMARQSLINADGVIETGFTPGPYCMQISAMAYDKMWRFDLEGLPKDLIRRGVAVEDPTQPHGVRLLIEDYPYAADGLLIWSAIERWVKHYVAYYYTDAATVQSDTELQSWYAEAVHVGHHDKRHEAWWPTLKTPADLSSILTTFIWLTSAHHAALNFGQYPYNGYIPNRPPMMRRLLPREGDPEYQNFVNSPEKYYLSSLPSALDSTKFMAVVDTLSTHSPDEEYLGQRPHQSTWIAELDMIEAFYKFSAEIQRIECVIQHRNSDPTLRNRCGAGVLPYELMMASSEAGVTGHSEQCVHLMRIADIYCCNSASGYALRSLIRNSLVCVSNHNCIICNDGHQIMKNLKATIILVKLAILTIGFYVIIPTNESRF